MKTVNGYYARALKRFAAEAAGMAVTEDSAASIGPPERVQLTQQGELWQRLECHYGSTLGIAFGQQIQVSDLGTLGHLLMSLPTLGEALTQLQRFYPLIGEGGELAVTQGKKFTEITYSPSYQQARQARIEAVITSIINVARMIYRAPLDFACIQLDYQPKPENLSELTTFSESDIIINQPSNSLSLANSILSRPIAHANAIVAQSLFPALEAELASLQQHEPKDRVIALLQNEPSLNREQVAQRLHMSVRTLCRHLKSADTQFARVRDEVCLDLANRALKNGSSVTITAELLGYSDSSAFVKAYRRWTGTTPKQAVF